MTWREVGEDVPKNRTHGDDHLAGVEASVVLYCLWMRVFVFARNVWSAYLAAVLGCRPEVHVNEMRLHRDAGVREHHRFHAHLPSGRALLFVY